MNQSVLVRALLFLRTFVARIGRDPDCNDPVNRARPVTVAQLGEQGFTLLARDPPREIVYGLIGKFWQLSGGVVASTRDSFSKPLPQGVACAVWNFAVVGSKGGSLVSTETRVLCQNSTARTRFRLYWAFVGPFSGLIRREMLKAIRAESERFSERVEA